MTEEELKALQVEAEMRDHKWEQHDAHGLYWLCTQCGTITTVQPSGPEFQRIYDTSCVGHVRWLFMPCPGPPGKQS